MKTMNLKIALPEGKPTEHVLGHTACIIGSDHLAHIRLQDDDIAGRHAVIEPRDDGWHIMALTDDCPIRINGIPTDSARLRPGDEVCIGAYRLSLHEQIPAPTQSVAPPAEGPARKLKALQKARRRQRRFRLNLHPGPETDIPEAQRRMEIRLIGWNTTLLDQKQLPVNAPVTIGDAADNTFVFPEDLLPSPSCTLVGQHEGERILNVPGNAACVFTDAEGISRSVEKTDAPIPLPPATAARIDIGDFSFHLRDIAAERVRSAPLARRFPYDSAAVWIIAYVLWGLLIYQVQLLPEAEVADIIDAAPNRTVVMNVDPEEDQPQPDPEPEQHAAIQVKQPARKLIGEEGKYGKETSVVDMGSGPVEDFVNDTGLLGAASDFMREMEQQPSIDQKLEQALASLEGPSGIDPHGIGGASVRGTGHGGGGINLSIGGIPFGSRRNGSFRTAMNHRLKTGPRGGMKKINPRQLSMISGADPSLIAKVMNKHLNQFRYCYQTQLRIFPNLYGKIAVQFVIEGNGRVSTARALSNTMRNAAVEDCVIRTVKRLMFPPIKGGGIARVTYPFLFTSQ